jgi:tetratricopeptide (TPR) repeat protein
MNLIKVKIWLVVFLSLALSANAQEEEPQIIDPKSSDEQLAVQYYQNKEFDKAAVYYERLFEKRQSDFYYDYLLDCLIKTNDFKKAEKLIRKQIKKSPLSYSYQVDLGYLHKSAGEDVKARKEFESIISSLQANQTMIFELANAFIKRKELDHALATYERGRKLLKGAYPFSFEMGEIYFQKGDIPAMINEYLEVLMISEAYIQQVQNYLMRIYSSSKTDDSHSEIVKTQLLRRIQKNPDKTVYSEMLIWLLIQEKDFNSALIQVKALDKRLKEDGARIITLAQTAASNGDYETAAKAYQTIIERGKDHYYYITCKIELLNVLNKKVLVQADYTKDDILTLEKNYLSAIDELGKNSQTASLLRGLGHLYAFYLHKSDEGIQLLEETINIPGVSKQFQAEVKLLLGDILLMTGDIWEASLYYSQVEKSFKHDPIGDEAKLRNARISYYTGDFAWAQAQLDVLKGSTSKLIANDAMELSLIISDNIIVDTNAVPLMLFSKAELLSFQNLDDQALLTLDSILLLFPAHSLADDVLFRKAKIMEKKQDFEAAAELLKQIINGYSHDILADDAMFRLAELYQTKFKDQEKAKYYYERILNDYPGSIYTVEARKRFRELRGDRL